MKIESAVFGEKHNKIGSRLSIYHQDSKIMKDPVIYLNWHKELELIMVEKGRLDLHIEGTGYQLEEGDIAVVNMGRLHYATALDGELIAWTHFLRGKWKVHVGDKEIII